VYLRQRIAAHTEPQRENIEVVRLCPLFVRDRCATSELDISSLL
jgi:hypothetical protein